MISKSSFTKLILSLALVSSSAIATGGQAFALNNAALSAGAIAQQHYGQIASSATAAYSPIGQIQPAMLIQQPAETHQTQPMMMQPPQLNHEQHQQAASMASMPMDQLMKQFAMSNYQTGGTNMHYNNHVSNIKVGNHESTNINNINNNLGTSISGSQVHSDVGNKNLNAPTTNFGANSVNTYSAGQAVAQPTSNVAVGANGYVPEVKVKATQEQKDLKKKLIDLAQKIANQAHDVSHPDESLVKLNKKTGLLTPLAVDPETAINKAKLDKALRALSSKKLPVDRLKEALSDDTESGTLQDNYQDQQPMYLQTVPLEQPPQPEYVEPEPEPEPEPEQIVAADPEVVEQVRAVLDDRINRISDLLYFRPEYLNQMLHVDDQNDLTPLESEFKRMVLCNSDEQFCGQDLSQWAQRQAYQEAVEHYDDDPAYEHVPEAEPVVIMEPLDDGSAIPEVAYGPRRNQVHAKSQPQLRKLVLRPQGAANGGSPQVASGSKPTTYRPQPQQRQQPMRLVVQNQAKPLGPNPYGGQRQQKQQQQQNARQKMVRDLNQQQQSRG